MAYFFKMTNLPYENEKQMPKSPLVTQERIYSMKTIYGSIFVLILDHRRQ